MTARVEAIFENGVFRPLKPMKGIKDKSRVTVEVVSPDTAAHPLDGCIGVLSDEDANEMMRIVEEEFEKVDPREWR